MRGLGRARAAWWIYTRQCVAPKRVTPHITMCDAYVFGATHAATLVDNSHTDNARHAVSICAASRTGVTQRGVAPECWASPKWVTRTK